MRKSYLLACVLLFSLSKLSHAQNSKIGDLGLPKIHLGIKVKPEVFLGPTASFSFGDYIRYQKSFHDAAFPETDISGSVRPLFFMAFGNQERFCFNDSSMFADLSVSIGINYYMRGFINRYHTVYTPTGLDVTDDMIFVEKYKLNQFSFPFLVRYGKKAFVELGGSLDLFLLATRKHKLKREVDGPNAYEGGFKTKDRSSYLFSRSQFKTKSIGLTLGLGYAFTDKFSLRLTNHLTSGGAFVTGDKFNSLNTQLEFLFSIK